MFNYLLKKLFKNQNIEPNLRPWKTYFIRFFPTLYFIGLPSLLNIYGKRCGQETLLYSGLKPQLATNDNISIKFVFHLIQITQVFII